MRSGYILVALILSLLSVSLVSAQLSSHDVWLYPHDAKVLDDITCELWGPK